METIIIYGMRGTGKSTIGKRVSKELGYIFIDLDTFIEDEIGMKLNEYIKINKWDIFRNKEHECLKKVLEIKGKKVISLGGGTIVFQRNIKEISKIKKRKLIFLETDINIIEKRIKKDEQNSVKRNSLTGNDIIIELQSVYKERESIYKENAEYIVNNNGEIIESIDSIKNIINNSKICIPISNFDENYIKKTFQKIKEVEEIQYVELRIDYLKDSEKLEKIIKKCPKKTIVTNRIKSQGGNFNGTYEESLNIQKNALKNGASLVDIELQLLENIDSPQIDTEKTIISHHDFIKTPSFDELISKLDEINKYNPRVFKIAVTPNTKNDVEIIYELTKYFKENFAGKDFIFISMGELGTQTRKDIHKKGGLLTFASIGGDLSAPGQIDYTELIK